MMTSVLLVVGAYLAGAIPTGLLAGRLLRGVDIREFGSGSTGTTNTLRTLGKGPAIFVLAWDIAKGAGPVLLARWLTGEPLIEVLAGLAAVAGHDWPVYAGFRGGRGVATTVGATLAMLPVVVFVALVVAAVLLWRWRYVSLMSIAATVTGAVLIVALAATGRIDAVYSVWAVAAAPLIVLLHRGNIRRLLAGTEPKLGQGGQRRIPPNTPAPSGGRSR